MQPLSSSTDLGSSSPGDKATGAWTWCRTCWYRGNSKLSLCLIKHRARWVERLLSHHCRFIPRQTAHDTRWIQGRRATENDLYFSRASNRYSPVSSPQYNPYTDWATQLTQWCNYMPTFIHICILEVHGLHLGGVTGYSEICRSFPQSLQANSLTFIRNRLRSPSNPFMIIIPFQ
jgi:hypothetical protein